MPTFHTTDTETTVSGTGDVAQQSDDTGTTIHYRGEITFNGQPLMSPRQLLFRWQAIRASVQKEADFYRDPTRYEGYAADAARENYLKARGRIAAYDSAILALTETATPAAAVAALEAALKLLDAAAPPDGDGRDMTDAALAYGERLLPALRRTASVTWIDDD